MCRDWCRCCSGRFHAFLNLTQYRYITHVCHYRRQLITALYPCGHVVIMGALYIDHYPSHMMPKLWSGVDCRKIAAAAITVNTSVGSGYSGPPTATFDSAWKIGQVTMLWVYNMTICRRYWCIGREHHGVGLFCVVAKSAPRGREFLAPCTAFMHARLWHLGGKRRDLSSGLSPSPFPVQNPEDRGNHE